MSNKSIDRVAVIVLNYKAIDDTLACIASLLQQTYANFHIVVVENGSADGSAEVLKKLQQQPSYRTKLSVVYNERNKGFAGGANSGILWARDNNVPYVALLNNDATADKDWVSMLVAAIKQNPRYGSVTGLLLKNDGAHIDSTAEQYSTWGLAFPTNRGKKVSAAPQEQALIFGATGGATLHRMEMLDQIGLFDKAFFAYYEDVDLSFRAQLANWKVVYTPKAIAYHAVGATSKKMPGFTVQQTFRNLPLLFIKNVPAALFIPIGIRLFLVYTLMLGKAIVKGSGVPALKGFFKGVGLFWSKGLVARRSVQSTSKVPTAYIKSILWHDLPPDQTGMRKIRKVFTGKS